MDIHKINSTLNFIDNDNNIKKTINIYDLSMTMYSNKGLIIISEKSFPIIKINVKDLSTPIIIEGTTYTDINLIYTKLNSLIKGLSNNELLKYQNLELNGTISINNSYTDLYGVNIINTSGSDIFFKMYDSIESGFDISTEEYSYCLFVNSRNSVLIEPKETYFRSFTNGLIIVATSDIINGSTAYSSCYVELLYK